VPSTPPGGPRGVAGRVGCAAAAPPPRLAERTFRAALALDPLHSSTRANLAIMLHTVMKDYENALIE